MRYFAFLALLTITLPVFSQKILVNETDKFSHTHNIETGYSSLKQAFSQHLQVRVRQVDTAYFITFRGGGFGVGVISPTDRQILLLDNDSAISVYPTSIQSYNISTESNWYVHQYSITSDQLRLLSKHQVKSIRKYYSDVFSDLDIPQKNQGNLQKLCALFLKTASL